MSRTKAKSLPLLMPLEALNGGYRIEYLASSMQPYYEEVLYVLDDILFVEPTIEDCVARFCLMQERHGPFTLVMSLLNPNRMWILSLALNEAPSIYFFRQDIVDTLLGKPGQV